MKCLCYRCCGNVSIYSGRALKYIPLISYATVSWAVHYSMIWHDMMDNEPWAVGGKQCLQPPLFALSLSACLSLPCAYRTTSASPRHSIIRLNHFLLYCLVPDPWPPYSKLQYSECSVTVWPPPANGVTYYFTAWLPHARIIVLLPSFIVRPHLLKWSMKTYIQYLYIKEWDMVIRRCE